MRYGVASIISTSESEPLHRPKLRSDKLTLPWRAEQYNDGDGSSPGINSDMICIATVRPALY